MTAPSETDGEGGQAVAAGQAAAPGARPSQTAGAPAATAEPDDSVIGSVRNKVGHEFDSKVYIYKTKIGDDFADEALDPLDNALTPGFESSVAAIDNALPPFLQGHVPWLSNYAKYVAVNNSKESLGNVVEDEIGEAAMGAKPGFLGGARPAGEDAPAAGAAAADAAPAGAGAGAGAGGQPAAAVAVAGAGGSPAAAGVTPAAMGSAAAMGGSPAGYAMAPPPAAWSIRMGRFATVGKAEQFAGDLARRGIAVRVEMVEEGGRLWSVVQHGRFASRGTAEGALRKLTERGYGGSVISDSTWGGAS